jgi:hypothetical protein
VTDRPARLLCSFAGQGDNVDNLFGSKGARGPRAGGIGQDRFDGGTEVQIVRVGSLGRRQVGRGRQPAGAPEADLAAIQPQVLADVAVADARCS